MRGPRCRRRRAGLRDEGVRRLADAGSGEDPRRLTRADRRIRTEFRHEAPETTRRRRNLGALGLALAVTIVGLYATGILLPSHGPRASGDLERPSAASTGALPTGSAAPSPRPVDSIVLITGPAPLAAGSRSALVWSGLESAAAALDAGAARAIATGRADLVKAVSDAAASGAGIVVTVDVDGVAVSREAALHPEIEFIAIEAAFEAPPPNLHSILFDESEMGYVAGAAAGLLSGRDRAGLAIGAAGQGSSQNYRSGFEAGVQEVEMGMARVEYAGADDLPDRGRGAVDRLAGESVGVVAAPDTLAGIGAMREACARRIALVALGPDAWVRFPELQSCVAASVVKRYDVTVRDAIAAYASGEALPARVIATVASGGIELTSLHVAAPAETRVRLDEIVAALRFRTP